MQTTRRGLPSQARYCTTAAQDCLGRGQGEFGGCLGLEEEMDFREVSFGHCICGYVVTTTDAPWPAFLVIGRE
jgi:hypothetical protein